MLLMCVFAALLLADEPPQPAPPMPDAVLERQNLLQLLTIRRVYVDRLTGGETAAQMRDMIMSSLHSAGLFVITESPERADAILRGSAEDLVFTENYSSNEGVNIRGSVGSGSSRSSRGYASAGIGENASSNVSQRRHEAMAAVRLINKEGDVIWSTTQESLGGKFRGASADVADKITRQLRADYERAKKLAGVKIYHSQR
ncbi:MAG TPA: hypothetical protein PLA43_03270 [Bryobacteraceae bacterium]|mgnify:CR=1 FL=1|nr:hypothetical protein [Bryobacteraceae bacterium]HOQ45840.1 hypothetical protein [Bryobacteraceae bacterium]HPQ17370.1 hypothetical protein [Bryobacteraceae bacterium]HPU70951.1 hypothetical protein [Bryobacteraceae bacterium]